MKKQNGITLISLIITIIIMLILAGVSLSMVMGDGSMLEQANVATTKTKVAEVQEYIDLAVANNKLAKYSKIGLKSKESLAAEMFSQGLITETERDKMLADEELKINDVVINYSEVKTTYDDATSAGVTEETDGTMLSGVWTFNSSLTHTGWASGTEQKSESINFKGVISEGAYTEARTSFDYLPAGSLTNRAIDNAADCEMVVINNSTLYGLYHFDHGADSCGGITFASGDTANSAYSTVDFGSTPQEVSQEFYDWFTANATKN